MGGMNLSPQDSTALRGMCEQNRTRCLPSRVFGPLSSASSVQPAMGAAVGGTDARTKFNLDELVAFTYAIRDWAAANPGGSNSASDAAAVRRKACLANLAATASSPGSCSGHGSCDADGFCLCDSGFYGRKCNNACNVSDADCRTFTFDRCPDTSLVYREFAPGNTGCGPNSKLRGTVWCSQSGGKVSPSEAAAAEEAANRTAVLAHRDVSHLPFSNHRMHGGWQPNPEEAKLMSKNKRD